MIHIAKKFLFEMSKNLKTSKNLYENIERRNVKMKT